MDIVESVRPLAAILTALIGACLIMLTGRRPNLRESVSFITAVVMFCIIAGSTFEGSNPPGAPVVAIAFEASTGALREHGSPTRIHCWANNTRRRLRASGALDKANDIVVISGPLPVDEINKCLKIDGYCRDMFGRLHELPHGKRLGASATHGHHTTH